MKSVLFVCTANMCRSPLAEGLFLKKLGEEKDGWRVESAGTWATEGTPASQKSLQVLTERGVDLSHHRAKVVSRELMGEFALILVMEEGQKEALRVEFPEYKDRVFLLSEMIGEYYEIDDPVGRDLEDYRLTAEEIDYILEKGFDTISRLAEGKDG
jgi:protein-tyrosine-phosphatase